jgi:hypothetical protein
VKLLPSITNEPARDSGGAKAAGGCRGFIYLRFPRERINVVEQIFCAIVEIIIYATNVPVLL